MRKVFLDNLPRWSSNSNYKGKINWRLCVGYKIKFIYDDIEDEVEIVSIDENSNYNDLKFKVKYKEKEKIMDVRNIRACRFGVLISKQPEYGEFKHEIGEIIEVKNGTLKIVNNLTNQGIKFCEYECLKCGNKDRIREYCLGRGIGCNVCANKKVLIGYNDMWTTHPKVAELLLDKNDGYKITYGAQIRLDFKCPICNHTANKLLSNVMKIGIGCPICSDGLSYPSKIMISILDQIGIDYEVEKTFKWSNQKRYDFYISKFNCIVEIHGEQHYINSFKHAEGRTLEEEQENDEFKEKLAKENGIENYIIIDCRFSELEYIRNNIMKSELINLLNFNIVNWSKCDEFALKSMVKIVCDLWNDGYDNTTKIGEFVKLSRSTIIKYLKTGTKIGWCEYDPKETQRKTSSETGKKKAINIVQLSSNGEYIKTWNSATDVKKELNILDSKIGEVCKGQRKSAGGYVWMYKDEYENRRDSVEPIKIGNSKEIVQLSLRGEYINHFESLSDASRKTGVQVSNISKGCRDNRRSCGFKWMYKDEYLKMLNHSK